MIGSETKKVFNRKQSLSMKRQRKINSALEYPSKMFALYLTNSWNQFCTLLGHLNGHLKTNMQTLRASLFLRRSSSREILLSQKQRPYDVHITTVWNISRYTCYSTPRPSVHAIQFWGKWEENKNNFNIRYRIAQHCTRSAYNSVSYYNYYYQY